MVWPHSTQKNLWSDGLKFCGVWCSYFQNIGRCNTSIFVNFFSVLQENFFTSEDGKQAGYIQTKLKNIRRDLSDDAKQRPRKNKVAKTLQLPTTMSTSSGRKRPREEDCIPDNSADELILLAKRTSIDQVQDITQAMKETFPNRQKWLEEKAPCVADIIERFPRYKDLPQLVRHCFSDVLVNICIQSKSYIRWHKKRYYY